MKYLYIVTFSDEDSGQSDFLAVIAESNPEAEKLAIEELSKNEGLTKKEVLDTFYDFRSYEIDKVGEYDIKINERN